MCYHVELPIFTKPCLFQMLGVELVLLNNCTYPGIEKGEQAMRLFAAFNRKKATIVCEYGDERLKALIRLVHRLIFSFSSSRAEY